MKESKKEAKRVAQQQKHIDRHMKQIEFLDKQLEKYPEGPVYKSNMKRKQKHLEKINLHKQIIADPEVARRIHQERVDNSVFTKTGNALTQGGESMKKTGKNMSKVGMHATGAVWTPVLYVGYQGIKKARKNKKEKEFQEDVRFYKETRGTDSVIAGLATECEEAYKDGKIDKEQFKHFLNDYIDNMY